MFEVSMKINGCMLVHIYGHNEGINIKYEEKDTYYYEVHLMNKNKVVSGQVLHHRPDGLEKLIYLVLGDYLKKEKKL